MTKRLLGILLGYLLCQNYLYAQEKSNIKFGRITEKDFEVSANIDDTSASAVILADIGNTYFQGSNKDWFDAFFKRTLRFRVNDKRGLDIGTQHIYLHTNGTLEDKLTGLSVTTYNLENGKVASTSMDNKAVFIVPYNKYFKEEKFTAPAVRPGSIIEISYTIKAYSYAFLHTWSFQNSQYPTLYSEYTVTVPPAFHYMTITRGDTVFDVKTVKQVFEKYTIQASPDASQNDVYGVSGMAFQQHWIKKNMAALKTEDFTTTIENHLASVSFQLDFVQQDPTTLRHNYLTTWPELSHRLLTEEDFGLSLNHENAFLTDDLKSLTANSLSDRESTRQIYYYVRDHFSCSERNKGIWLSNTIGNIYKNRTGSSTEINLLLVAMLRKANISADPVILSTRDNGVANMTYPFIQEFNYVICAAHANGQTVLLDASRPTNGFGNLNMECFNGGARVVNETKPDEIFLSPDSVQETTNSAVFISNDEKGFPSGTYESVLGKQESDHLRETVNNSDIKNYFKHLQSTKESGFEMENEGIDSLQMPDYPVKVHYEFNVRSFNDELVYFKPILDPVYQKNPFQATTRLYPVEMPSKINYTYLLTMEIPKGYQIDDLPKSAKVAFDEDQGYFEYLIQKSESNIQMRVHIKMNRAFFPKEEYAALRDFFGFIVKKENEVIVFKKKG